MLLKNLDKKVHKLNLFKTIIYTRIIILYENAFLCI